MVEILPFRAQDPLLRFEDTSGNKQIDAGEVVFFEDAGERFEFVYKGQDQGLHILTAKFAETDFFYHNDLGFVFQEKTTDGDPIAVASGFQPWAVSSYEVLGHMTNWKGNWSVTLVGELSGEFLANAPDLSEAKQVGWGQDYRESRVMTGLVLQNDFTREMLMEVQRKLQRPVTLQPEGERVIDDEALSSYLAYALSNNDVNARASSTHFRVYYQTHFVRKIFDPNLSEDERKKWQNAFLSNFVHEVAHLAQGEDFNDTQDPKAHTAALDDHPHVLISNFQWFMDGSMERKKTLAELVAFQKDNPDEADVIATLAATYKSLGVPQPTLTIFRNRLLTAMQEIGPTLAQLSFMVQMGVENFPPEYVATISEYVCQHVDYVMVFRHLDQAEPILRETFQGYARDPHLKGVHELVLAQDTLTPKQRERYKAFTELVFGA